MKLKKKHMLLLLIFFSLVNLALSISIEIQKNNNENNFLQNNCTICDPESGNDCVNSCVEGCNCNSDFLMGNCFAESAENNGCYEVQSSKYSDTFGISNPVYGIVSFSLIFLLLLSLKIAIKNKDKTFLRKNFGNIKIVIFFLILSGLLISLWFLYLQFFIIGSICKYCLAVDGIMIIMAFLYAKLIF